MITSAHIGEYSNKKIYSYTLDNNNGLVAEILNYGGAVKKLIYNGVDVVLGYDNADKYLENKGYFGALVGRNSNRIENAEFEFNGEKIQLEKNNNNNNLHGGKIGFSHRVWDAQIIDAEEPSLKLSLQSNDGEEGFPGNLTVTVTYTLTKDNSFKIHYEGISDKDTVLNMTNHSYFNLNGHGNGDILEHTLWLDSNFYTPNKEGCLPNGEILRSFNTPFDFSIEKTLKQALDSDCEQIKMFGGIDHNFVLNNKGYGKAGRLCGSKSGIIMELYTDRCGVQIYTGNGIDENETYKDGKTYKNHFGICLETQSFPNGVNYPHFPNMILKKGEKFDSVTSYKFVCK